jgi:tetratricopeptide (TPR) repeat protein
MKRLGVSVGIFLGVALLATSTRAQTGWATGRVVDTDGNPLPGATVALKYLDVGARPWNFEVKTNKKGEYVQSGLVPGRWRLTASKEGYETTGIESVVSAEPMEMPDIVLHEAKPVEQGPKVVQVDLREKFKNAVELTRAGKLDEAEAIYKELLEPMADVAELHQNLGYLYAQKKDWAKAEASYLKALELKPGDSAIISGLAEVYEESGQKEKALALVSKAAEANPKDAVVNFNRGVYLLNAGQAPEAVQAFEAALAADPGLVEAHYHLATLLIGQGKVAEAVQHLETYLASNPTDEQNVATAKGLLQALKK